VHGRSAERVSEFGIPGTRLREMVEWRLHDGNLAGWRNLLVSNTYQFVLGDSL
jgi:hypothetical protein